MPNLMDILKKILISYDFEVRDEYPNYVLGGKEGTSVVIAVLPEEGEVTVSDIVILKEQIPPDLDKIIFVTRMDVDPNLETFAADEDILLWGKKKLEEEIGRAVLGGSGVDFLGEPTSATETKEAPSEISEEISGEMSQEEEQGPIEIQPIPIRLEPKGQEEEGELIMKPQITMSEVSEISKKIVQGFRFDLELIPYYVFDYFCELVVEGQTQPQMSRGTLAVNGLTNSAERWDFDYETLADLDTTHTKLEPKFDEDRAFSTAKESAITLNTREVQTVDDRGAVTIYEKRKVRPKEGAIDIERRGLVYLPVWCVEGSNGVMIINATTGKVIKEDIYREEDDLLSRSSSSGFSY